MLQRISITGNIGSGKTTVAKLFERLGIPVYYSDQRAKDLMANDLDLRRSISSEFGSACYDEQGRLDRKYLAAQVVGQPERLEVLNSLVHPAVAKDSLEWHLSFSQSGSLSSGKDVEKVPYTLHESAIILEINGEAAFDAVLVVTAPEEVRLQRVMDRDQVEAEYVKKWMARQWPEAQKVAKADYLIHNYDNRLLLPQVLAVHRQLQHEE